MVCNCDTHTLESVVMSCLPQEKKEGEGERERERVRIVSNQQVFIPTHQTDLHIATHNTSKHPQTLVVTIERLHLFSLQLLQLLR